MNRDLAFGVIARASAAYKQAREATKRAQADEVTAEAELRAVWNKYPGAARVYLAAMEGLEAALEALQHEDGHATGTGGPE